MSAATALHRRRLEDLARISEAEQALERELQEALLPASPPVGGFWAGLRRTWAGERSADPDADTPWARYERTMARVRALGHLQDALERDLALVHTELAALNEEAVAVARDEVLAREWQRRAEAALARLPRAHDATAAAEADALDQAAWTAGRDAERFGLAGARIRDQLDLLREVRELMEDTAASLGRIYRSGAAALDHLGRQVSALSAVASAEETARSVEALQLTVRGLSGMVTDGATSVSDSVDALEERLRRLDREAALRRAAQEEVERALARGRRG